MVEFHQKKIVFKFETRARASALAIIPHFLNVFFLPSRVSNEQKEESERRNIIQHYLHREYLVFVIIQ